MATILTAFRTSINDGSAPYTVADAEALRYLDSAIDALSTFVRNPVKETVTVTATDITNGYFETTKDIQHVLNFGIEEFRYWTEDNKVRFVNSSDWSANTYDIEYNAYYLRFDGEDHDDSYFDYPKRAELGLILWALGEWMDDKSATKADGSSGAVKAKREQNMEVEYSVGGEGGVMTTGDQARKKARKLWARLPNYKSAIFSVSSFL